jgi:hypothetical protein
MDLRVATEQRARTRGCSYVPTILRRHRGLCGPEHGQRATTATKMRGDERRGPRVAPQIPSTTRLLAISTPSDHPLSLSHRPSASSARSTNPSRTVRLSPPPPSHPLPCSLVPLTLSAMHLLQQTVTRHSPPSARSTSHPVTLPLHHRAPPSHRDSVSRYLDSPWERPTRGPICAEAAARHQNGGFSSLGASSGARHLHFVHLGYQRRSPRRRILAGGY